MIAFTKSLNFIIWKLSFKLFDQKQEQVRREYQFFASEYMIRSTQSIDNFDLWNMNI